MQTLLLAHIASGERYVVTVGGDDRVVEACGPLHYDDIAAALRDGFDSDADLVDDINADLDAYRVAVDQVA